MKSIYDKKLECIFTVSMANSGIINTGFKCRGADSEAKEE